MALGGIRVRSEPILPQAVAGGAMFKVYDAADKGPEPCFIRIQNNGTEPILFSEDMVDANGAAVCSAVMFTGIIPGASAVGAGDGGVIEYSKLRPNKVYLFATNNYNLVGVKRYAFEN